MNQEIVEQEKRGSELVVEFLNNENSRLSPALLEQMLKLISDTYHCSPEDLKITDDEAGTLIRELYLITSHKELEIAKMPFASK